MNLLLAAFDTGRMNGWATFSLPNEEDGYRSGEVPQEHLWDYLETLKLPLSQGTRVIILAEKFKYRHDQPIDFGAIETLGVIKEWCRQNNVEYREELTRAESMFFWTDLRLKEYELYNPKSRHARDAMRLLLYYVYFVMNLKKIERKVGT
jgi:hypothetical protein